jgi:hypothetical protein
MGTLTPVDEKKPKVCDQDARAIFKPLLHPDDSYTPDGTYWADLPLPQLIAFVTKVDRTEAARELGLISKAIRKNPFSPLAWYFRNSVAPGLGIGLKGYVIFAIGNLQALFASTWPQCWGAGAAECSAGSVASASYTGIIGITIGQVGVGALGDWLGMRWGLIQDAILMSVGLFMMTGSWGVNLQGWVFCYAVASLIYGMYLLRVGLPSIR